MKTSAALTGIGSVATSGVPSREKIRVTSGTPSKTAFSVFLCIATDPSRLMLLSRVTSAVNEPSSNLGMNSAPNRLKTKMEMINSASAAATTSHPSRKAMFRMGR
jgi:hypothetical protein